MAESVSFPFQVPVFATTQGAAAVGIAITGHPTAYNGFLNQCTTLYCTRAFLRGGGSPFTGIPRNGIYDFPFIERYNTHLKFAHPYTMDLIRRMLDSGFYIHYCGVDDYYLPGKSWYGLRHMNHDGVICGYDESDRTYSIAAYDINWIFSLMRIPQDCFAEGLKSCIERKEYGNLIAYRVRKDATVALDEKMILRYLKEHLTNTVDRFPLNQEGTVTGLAVHDFVAMYVGKLRDGSLPVERMDWRALRPVWEHKRCMLDRLRAVEEKHGWAAECSTEYAPLVEKANRLRMMYAMFHKNQKAGLLGKIEQGLLELREQENIILQKFVTQMEESSV